MELLLLLVLDPHLSGSSWFEEDPAIPQMHVVGGRVLIPKAKPLVRPLLLLLLLLLVTVGCYWKWHDYCQVTATPFREMIFFS